MWRIAGTGYLSGTPKKAPEEWPSEWFYIDDVALPDPIRMGLPKFSNALLKKHHSWHPRSLEEECRYQNRRISGRGSRTVRLGRW